MIYIHYGAERFDRSRFRNVWNRIGINKPGGGLWGSPIEAERGWYNWCIEEEFQTERLDKSFRFELAEGANVLYIDSDEAATKLKEEYPARPEAIFSGNELLPAITANYAKYQVDWVKVSEEYDAVVYYENSLLMRWEFYGWDCDSIVVLNPDVIREVI